MIKNIEKNKRKGISTIIGTIIFIGILFTSIVPMFITMNQADTYAIQKKDELERLDQQRFRENCIVYLYPTGPETPLNLTIMVTNTGPEIINIVRFWLNDNYYTVNNSNSTLRPYESKELASINPNPVVDDTFNAYATSDRGNLFTNEGGSITYINVNGTGGWGINEYLLNVLINGYKPGIYRIEVYKKDHTAYLWPEEPWDEAQPNHNGGSTLQVFKIPMENADYKVIIKSGSFKYTGYAHVIHPGLNIYWIVTPPE
ncbi:hypothetical protein JW865_09255 [Candidatus Bathyarchaeota archaeon]|nr:hypothetical protein [Candidatus Bathyarchaeota archaeon]